MSKRKPHNMWTRLERTCRALVSANHSAVVNVDPSGLQVLVNWKNLKQICVRQVVDADCDIPHRWTIYLSLLCRTEFGERYHKSVEVAPQGNYRAEHLTDVNEATYTDLRATANPKHLVAIRLDRHSCRHNARRSRGRQDLCRCRRLESAESSMKRTRSAWSAAPKQISMQSTAHDPFREPS